MDKVKLSVVHQYGEGITIQEFNSLFADSTSEVKNEIALAITNALDGLEPHLEIVDDTGLT